MRPRTTPAINSSIFVSIFLASLGVASLGLASVGTGAAMAQDASTPPASASPPSAAAPSPAPPGYPPPAPYYPQPGYYPPVYPAPGYPPAYAAPGYPPVYPAPGYPPAYAAPGYPPPYPPAGYPPAPGYAPAARARAQPQHIHDGLYLRLHLGINSSSVSGRITGIDTEYSGLGISFGAAAGVAIVRNLIVFATLTLATTSDTSLNLGGYPTTPNADLNLYGFGGGLAYYVELVNMYAAAAVMGMKADLSPSSNGSGQSGMNLTRLGPGFELVIGKEWWISENWGLGVAGQVMFSTMTSADDPTITMHGSSYGFLFSATYN